MLCLYGAWCHVDRRSTARLKNAGLMLFADCLLTQEKTVEFVDGKDLTFSIFLHGYESLLNGLLKKKKKVQDTE